MPTLVLADIHGNLPALEAVLAHPAELEQKEVVLRMLIESWQKQGLMGVEVYHPSQQKRGFAPLDAVVRRMGLLRFMYIQVVSNIS